MGKNPFRYLQIFVAFTIKQIKHEKHISQNTMDLSGCWYLLLNSHFQFSIFKIWVLFARKFEKPQGSSFTTSNRCVTNQLLKPAVTLKINVIA